MESGERSYRRYRSGDDAGLAELLKAYGDPLMLYLNSFVGDIQLAEDLMQEVFITLAVEQPEYDAKKASFKTWLFTIGRNIALNYLKKHRRWQKVPLEDHPELEDTADVEEEALVSERNRRLYAAMRTLNPLYRQVLYLTFFEGFSNAEAAAIMHKTKRQIENLLYNAKKALRAELERRGFHDENL